MFLSALRPPNNKKWGSELIDKSCMEICQNTFCSKNFNATKHADGFQRRSHHHECHHQSPHKRLQTFLCPPLLSHHHESLLLSLLLFKTLYTGRVQIWGSRVKTKTSKYFFTPVHSSIWKPSFLNQPSAEAIFCTFIKLGGVLNKCSLIENMETQCSANSVLVSFTNQRPKQSLGRLKLLGEKLTPLKRGNVPQ